LRNTLDEVVTLLAHSSHDKGLELTLNIKNDVPDNVIGDPLRLTYRQTADAGRVPDLCGAGR
ncbi:hypothetical protein ONQ60_25615, partial [Salmonella enterica subsp. enterica serovar Virginia]|nr:hypothetical protein [Salmonella enterica subsp. enterica serovar Virginia]